MADKQRTPPINANSNRPAISSKCLENRKPRTTHTHTDSGSVGKVECGWLVEWEELEQTKLLINFPSHCRPSTLGSTACRWHFSQFSLRNRLQSLPRCGWLTNLPNGVRRVFMWSSGWEGENLLRHSLNLF